MQLVIRSYNLSHSCFDQFVLETANHDRLVDDLQIFICGWWVCPELYLRRPFHSHASSRLDALLEAKAREGVQVWRFSSAFVFTVNVYCAVRFYN